MILRVMQIMTLTYYELEKVKSLSDVGLFELKISNRFSKLRSKLILLYIFTHESIRVSNFIYKM